ncbi:MAG: nucleotidyltransferase [Nitrospira sp.]|nr:nucleotidyltransferase [Nitrospira sp.]
MSDELDVLKAVTADLEGAGIPYMVTGSMAANFYTVPRMTRDIDLVVELSERDVDRVTRLFQQDYYIDRDMVQRAVRDHAMFNMIHNALVVKVDCVVRKETEYRREEFARRRTVSIAGQQVFIVSPEDLILSKLDWAKESRSEMQLTDVRNLLNSVQGLDTAYLSGWADRLGLLSLYREVSA